MDTMKVARKAQQARSEMSKLSVAGQSRSGGVAMLLNGLNEIEEISFSDELLSDVSAEKLEKEVIEAYDTARKALEKELAGTMDMDSIRDMFS